ncbi:hypothetical protein AAFF_G00351730 [Aldrovandia affinis]|uniref:Uncharacterized protein n=1 Tax=Aldrovandia affinis TaxID=143900 RepID=A0AAD7SL14_9TELE|nr:hypothetical protein AAFF_G00351730 [Aldrovandia affinis]
MIRRESRRRRVWRCKIRPPVVRPPSPHRLRPSGNPLYLLRHSRDPPLSEGEARPAEQSGFRDVTRFPKGSGGSAGDSWAAPRTGCGARRQEGAGLLARLKKRSPAVPRQAAREQEITVSGLFPLPVYRSLGLRLGWK